MEKQEGEAQTDKGGGSRTPTGPEGQAEKQDVQQVGRPIPCCVYGKTGGMQAPHTRRHRRPVFLEQRHVAEVFCIGCLQGLSEENN